MGNAISACFKKYATFTGRASRSEFWYFALFYFIIYIVGAVVGSSMGNEFISYLFIAPIIIPYLSVAVRRLHDVNKSGWFYLVPFYNIALFATAGTQGPNKYGDAA
jgi:uncharacterized membrane protein YhaH (DUF805 family)